MYKVSVIAQKSLWCNAVVASTDDDQIVSYLWEQVSGKVGSQTNIDTSDLEKPMLVLKGLAPGKYRFKYVV